MEGKRDTFDNIVDVLIYFLIFVIILVCTASALKSVIAPNIYSTELVLNFDGSASSDSVAIQKVLKLKQEIENERIIINEIVKSHTSDRFNSGLFTGIITLLGAIAGLFGVKTMRDIKLITINKSKEAAQESVKKIVESTMEAAKLEGKMSGLTEYEKERELTAKEMADFERRIEALESITGTSSQESGFEPVLPEDVFK